jgi:polar amino acid transport system permease protein
MQILHPYSCSLRIGNNLSPAEYRLGFGAAMANRRIGVAFILSFIISVAVGEAVAATAANPSVMNTVIKWMPLVFKGFLMNLLVSILSMTIGTISGVVLGLGLVSLIQWVRKTSWFLTQFFRNAPWLVLVFYTIALIPFEIEIGSYAIPFPGWLKATLGLALPVMANTAEIVRGGIQSIPLGQWESAESLAFSRFQTIWSIILPQCFKRMIPPWMNLYAILTTASPLISLVGVNDALLMTRSALMAEGRSELLLPMYTALLIMFFLYCYPIAYYTVKLERRFAVK